MLSRTCSAACLFAVVLCLSPALRVLAYPPDIEFTISTYDLTSTNWDERAMATDLGRWSADFFDVTQGPPGLAAGGWWELVLDLPDYGVDPGGYADAWYYDDVASEWQLGGLDAWGAWQPGRQATAHFQSWSGDYVLDGTCNVQMYLPTWDPGDRTSPVFHDMAQFLVSNGAFNAGTAWGSQSVLGGWFAVTPVLGVYGVNYYDAVDAPVVGDYGSPGDEAYFFGAGLQGQVEVPVPELPPFALALLAVPAVALVGRRRRP